MFQPSIAYSQTQFKVVNTVDANQPALMSPAQYEVEIQKNIVISHFLTSVPYMISLRLSVDIPRRGFCVGENIPLNVLLENRGDKTTRCTLEAAIVRKATYSAQGKSKESSDRLIFESYPMTLQERTTLQQAINLTATSDPNLANCSIISVQYSVIIRVIVYYVVVSPLTVEIPITLGNVPSQSLAEQQPPPPYS